MPDLQLAIDDRDVAWLTLDRAHARNAFDGDMVAALADAAQRVRDAGARAMVLGGAGPSFCAGADVGWMRAMRDRSREENLADARALAAMFQALDALPCAVIGRVHGHAIGGGVGLVAACDVVVAATDTTFALGEVQLGLAPATIAPFVVRKIGRSHARALFVTGERFDAAWAERIGLVHYAVEPEDLDMMVEALLDQVLTAGPGAVAAAKRLPELASAPLDEALEVTAEIIADLRVGAEGQEGTTAFLEQRRPSWAPE